MAFILEDGDSLGCPKITGVTFSSFPATGADGRDVLRTQIDFEDGTFVRLANSAADKVTMVDAVEKLKPKTVEETVDGKKVRKTVPNVKELGVKVASDTDKERAILYGVLKRLVGSPVDGGEVVAPGLGTMLKNIVKDSYDVTVENRKRQLAEKAAAEKAAKKKAKRDARKAKRVSKLDRLIDAVEKLVSAQKS